MTVSTAADFKITWEKMPEDFILEERPAANIDQPLLAAALREILEIARLILEKILVAPNMGICGTMDSKTVMKVPDLFYARNVQPLPSPEVRHIYTPNLEKKEEIPAIVMEFLGATQGDEYSAKPTFPPGKLFFVSKYCEYQSMPFLSRQQDCYTFISEIHQEDINYRKPMQTVIIG